MIDTSLEAMTVAQTDLVNAANQLVASFDFLYIHVFSMLNEELSRRCLKGVYSAAKAAYTIAYLGTDAESRGALPLVLKLDQRVEDAAGFIRGRNRDVWNDPELLPEYAERLKEKLETL